MAPSEKRPVHLGAKTKAAIPDALNGRDPPYPTALPYSFEKLKKKGILDREEEEENIQGFCLEHHIQN